MTVYRHTCLLFVTLGVAACTEAPEPTDGDAVPERLVTGDTLRASFDRDGDWYVSPVLEAPSGATRAGFLLTVSEGTAETPLLEARGLDHRGEAGEWVRARVTWSEGTQRVGLAELGMKATAAQIRVHAADVGALADLLWSAVVPVPEETFEGEAPVAEVGGRSEALRAELSDIVNGRASWGARGTRCSSADPSKYRMAIHHTVTPSSGDIPTRLRGIQSYHMDTRGWCDIGYHFLVSVDGRLWEGRELRFLGSHVASNNTGNIGIAFIGCFHSSGCSDWTPFTPPDVMIDSAATLVGRLSGLYGIDVDSSTVKGHRDHSGASTSCPGDNLHARLDEIRSGASGPAAWAAEYVHQSFPLAREPYPLPAGTEDEGYIELRNVGSETWRPGETFLGTTEPRDGESPIASPSWIAPNRAATVDREVPPGETGRFVFRVRAPDTPGEYPQYFNLVQEGVAWFGDPGQGGPPDDQLQVRVTSMAWDAGPPDAGTEVGADAGPELQVDAGVPATADGGVVTRLTGGESMVVKGGCGCAVPGAGPSRGGWLALLGTILLTVVRRRRVILRPWRR